MRIDYFSGGTVAAVADMPARLLQLMFVEISTNVIPRASFVLNMDQELHRVFGSSAATLTKFNRGGERD